MLAEWTEGLAAELDAVDLFDARAGSTAYRVFLLPGSLQVDLSFAPGAEFGARGPRFRLLFGASARRPAGQAGSASRPRAARHLFGVGAHHAVRGRFCVERGRPWQAEHWTSGTRGRALALACRRRGLQAAHGRGLDRLPAGSPARLEPALVGSLGRRELLRALGAAVEGLPQEAGEARGPADRLAPRLREPAAATFIARGRGPARTGAGRPSPPSLDERQRRTPGDARPMPGGGRRSAVHLWLGRARARPARPAPDRVVTVRRLRRGEGERLRELRLRALAEAPYAFATSLEAARARPAEQWEEFARKSEAAASQVTFVAFEDGRWLGMAGAFLDPDGPGEARMVQMQVDPASRGLGLGRLLVEAVAEWAGGRGVTRLKASVTDGNRPAEVLYEGVGFLPTGDRRPLASDPALTEVALARDL